uniref:Uncharacterized protein n=1 Tax=Anguilla anguilla TaxID=7936 RepID=A0A0E9RJV1_ANGAN
MGHACWCPHRSKMCLM